MPDTEELVINTGPVLALVAALGSLQVLQIYRRVIVPMEVCQEIRSGGTGGFALPEFDEADWLHKQSETVSLPPLLHNALDRGEAAVIQTALDQGLQTVCIDESRGRRIARLSGLSVTGSIGILLRARREGYSFSVKDAVQRMQERGIWLSDRVIRFALTQAGEL